MKCYAFLKSLLIENFSLDRFDIIFIKRLLRPRINTWNGVFMIESVRKIVNDAYKKGIILQKNRQSLDWLAKRARSMRMSSSRFIREDGHKFVTNTNLAVGKMYMFFYDPKWKNELPYYDRFPCIFILDVDKETNSFLGLNLHYLDYQSRAILLDALLKYENNSNINQNKRLKINYGVIKSFAQSGLAKPCIKRYLFSHIRSKFIWVNAEEWHIVSMLPVHTWEKASASTVWRDSRKKSR